MVFARAVVENKGEYTPSDSFMFRAKKKKQELERRENPIQAFTSFCSKIFSANSIDAWDSFSGEKRGLREGASEKREKNRANA